MKWRTIIYTYLCTCIITGLIFGSILGRTVKLTEKETEYYTSVAEKVWYNGLYSIEKDDSITIKIDINEREIKILPNNSNKQSITVNFSGTQKRVVVNDSIRNFKNSFISSAISFGSIIYLIEYGIVCAIKEKQK